ncbi:rhodanese-like domain-containing protein [Flagellimonas pelagia]|uniref:Rhodanese-like domain-containing protein n=1 Tax=Flagellimonas pelagia TaxID=2306998 RepID=A0A3A1NK65_9FLAO|nr:rhodanese-like domain-containing protein [Allomuricauda maritima]RIV46439.1 rhodanese-like domain-containing protein [Allomuricauda maritima]TXJ99100.1 rhodanese-like domain-containing protein [Allomuricauda maritima]
MQHIFKKGLYLVFFVGILSCQSQDTTITRVDKEAIKAEVIGKDVQLVDVRTPEEYNAGHIDDAINFDLSNRSAFMKQVETLDKDQPVYVYCLVGSRSAYAAKILRSKGFTKIYDYSGGYNDWMKN